MADVDGTFAALVRSSLELAVSLGGRMHGRLAETVQDSSATTAAATGRGGLQRNMSPVATEVGERRPLEMHLAVGEARSSTATLRIHLRSCTCAAGDTLRLPPASR